MKCRHCASELRLPLVDLGSAPPSNAYLTVDMLSQPERWYPLRVLVCQECWLVQTEDFACERELFDKEYAYFSGFSTTWLRHCEAYVSEVSQRFSLGSGHLAIELATNDGSLLQYVHSKGISCLGIEPTKSTADAARAKGIAIIQDFFGSSLAKKLASQDQQADLLVANNVLAHVPNINDFVLGMAILLKPEGVATVEFPHLLHLCLENQFDTIYHEHYSYLSLTAAERIFQRAGLSIFDVTVLPTHGGSLRVFVQREDTSKRARSPAVDQILEQEIRAGIRQPQFYQAFQFNTERAKNRFNEFLIGAKQEHKTVAAYGAAAKGNTLLNYAGVRPDLISFVADRNPKKQGRFLPGSRIPIVDEQHLRDSEPDYVVVFPWNLKSEIVEQLDYVRAWQGRFVTAVPELSIV